MCIQWSERHLAHPTPASSYTQSSVDVQTQRVYTLNRRVGANNTNFLEIAKNSKININRCVKNSVHLRIFVIQLCVRPYFIVEETNLNGLHFDGLQRSGHHGVGV